MNDRLTASPQTADADGGRSCQAEGCSLTPSLLPWMIELGDVTLALWLCHGHGETLTRQAADAGGEAA